MVENMAPRVNAVRNAHMILKFLADRREPVGVAVVSRHTGISPSSCFNILRTLVELRLASFHEESKGYAIGLGLFELAQNSGLNRALISTAQPILTALAQRYSCQTGLWEFSEDDRTLIAMGESQAVARLHIRIGQKMPIGAGSSGRAFMGKYYHDKARLLSAYKAVEWQGSLTFEGYVDQIGKALSAGYAVDRDELYSGVTTISSAFEDYALQRQFCLSIFILSAQYSGQEIEIMGNELKAKVDLLQSASPS